MATKLYTSSSNQVIEDFWQSLREIQDEEQRIGSGSCVGESHCNDIIGDRCSRKPSNENLQAIADALPSTVENSRSDDWITRGSLETKLTSQQSQGSSFNVAKNTTSISVNSVAIPTAPSVTSYGGEYGFKLVMGNQEKDAKSVSWTYSETVEKLFVRMGATCPIGFETSQAPPDGCIIQAKPVYLKAEHAQDPVRRCAHHASAREGNEGHPFPDHLLRCQHPIATYNHDANNDEHSVRAPYQPPQVGQRCTTLLYQFMCFSSCVGGLNRRPLLVVFTLEQDGVVLGRQQLEVRICACPGRDRRVDERAFLPQSTTTTGLKRTLNDERPCMKKRKLGQEHDQQVFVLTVTGRQQYETLCRVRDALELAHLIPTNQIQAYKRYQEEVDRRMLGSCTDTRNNDIAFPGGQEQKNSSAPVIEKMNYQDQLFSVPLSSQHSPCENLQMARDSHWSHPVQQTQVYPCYQ